LSGADAKPASINLWKLVLSPTGSINLGFIHREDLLLCSSYLPLGVPNWAVIHLPSPPRSSAISVEPPPIIPCHRSVFSSKKLILASPSSSIEVLEFLNITPLAAMDPKSPSSRHLADTEEEDSPLQQSASTSGQPTTDSYPEDIASEAEEDAEDQAIEEMVDEEEQDGSGEAEQGGRIAAEEAEQIPANLHGYWVKSHVKNAHILALENEDTVAPRAESQWQTDHKALVPAPNKAEILMLKSHIERGLSMPPSHFFSNLL
jgi:hypothetical protein